MGTSINSSDQYPHNRKRGAFALLFFIFSFSLLAAQNPGTKDPSFGQGGYLFPDHDDFDWLKKVVVAPGDGFYVLGETGHSDSAGFDMDYIVCAYDADGNPDTAFAAGGCLRGDFGTTGYADPRDLLLQPDGKLLLLGAGYTLPNVNERLWFLNRLMPDGSPDTGFGTGGSISFHFQGGIESPEAIALYPDGRILVAGATFDTAAVHSERPCIARFLADGTPDSTFGSTGKRVLNYATGWSDSRVHSNGGSFHDIAIEDDGRILCFGSWFNGDYYQCAAAALLSDGSPDPGFYSGGVLVYDLEAFCNHRIEDAEALGDGSYGLIIYAGCDGGAVDMRYQRFYPSGPLTTDLGLDVAGEYDHASAVCADSAGGFILAGGSIFAANLNPGYVSDEVSVLRIDPRNGQKQSFGSGTAFHEGPVQPLQSGATSVAVQSDGSILVGGFVYANSGSNTADMMLLRLSGGPLLSADAGLSGTGVQVYPNPASDWLQIDGVTGEVALFDLEGRRLREREGAGMLSLEGLAAGMYLLRYREGDVFNSHKVMIR